MEPITLRLPEDLFDELEAEADERGFSSRSEYIRMLLRSRSGTDPTTAGHERSGSDYATTDRVADLEARVAALEHRVGGGQAPTSAPTAPPGDDRPRGPGDGDASPTAARAQEETNDAAATDAEAGSSPPPLDEDELREAYEAYLVDRPPKKGHTKAAVVDALLALHDRGTAATKELKDAVYPGYEEHYNDEVAMWNSLDRHLKELPGFEKGGYGEWQYAGDDVVRAALDGLESET